MYYKIKRYPVQDLLIFIGNYNLDMFNNGSPVRSIEYKERYGEYKKKCTSYICSWDLKDIAYNSVKYSNDYRSGNIDLKGLYEIIDEYRKNEDKKLESTNINSIFHLLYGLTQQQFWYQERYEIIEQFNRNVELLKYVPKEMKTSVDIENIMHEVLGISVDEYLYISLSMFALSLKSVDISEFAKTGNGIDFIDIEHSKILRFIKLYTADYEEIRNSPLEENIFLAKPIVKTDKGKYIIHNHYLILRILSDGLYWVIRNYYYNKRSQTFTNEFGRYFEKYVENIFNFYLNDVHYYKPIEIKGKKIADWVIETEKYIIIIEQKSMIASLKLKKPLPNIEDLNEYIKRYSEAFEQLNSTENELFNNRKDKRIIKLILHYDSLYPTEMLKSEICKYRINNSNQDKNIFFISIRELEILSYLINSDKNLFNKVMKEKIIREDNNSLDGRDFHMVFKKYNIKKNSYLINSKNHFNDIMEELRGKIINLKYT